MTGKPNMIFGPPELRNEIHAQPSIYAVMDGALYDDLPATLKDAGLQHRSLFLDHADKEVEKAGPWLVPLDDIAEVDCLLAIVGWLPAAVFWRCDSGEAALYRHLRTINKVIYPYRPSIDSPDVRDEVVLFRHWDPVVLSQVLPTLTPDQFNRVMGPAQIAIFYAVDNGGLLKAVPSDANLLAPKRMLSISQEQAEEIADARKMTSHKRIARHLRMSAPEKTGHFSEDHLVATVSKSEVSGRQAGLTTEKALARWAYLYIASGGNVAHSSKVRSWLTQGDHSPNRKIAALIRGALLNDRHKKGERLSMPQALGVPNGW